VQSSIIFRGQVTSGSAPFLIAYLGTQDVFLEAPYSGAFFAPNANLTLGATSPTVFTGQYFRSNDHHTTRHDNHRVGSLAGEPAEMLARVIGGNRCHWNVQMPADRFGDGADLHALVADRMPHRARRSILHRQAEEARGIEPVYRNPSATDVLQPCGRPRYAPSTPGRWKPRVPHNVPVDPEIRMHGDVGRERASLHEQENPRHQHRIKRGHPRRGSRALPKRIGEAPPIRECARDTEPWRTRPILSGDGHDRVGHRLVSRQFHVTSMLLRLPGVR
jgi:hypothetical protein